MKTALEKILCFKFFDLCLNGNFNLTAMIDALGRGIITGEHGVWSSFDLFLRSFFFKFEYKK